jgi:hypothetical protein
MRQASVTVKMCVCESDNSSLYMCMCWYVCICNNLCTSFSVSVSLWRFK